MIHRNLLSFAGTVALLFSSESAFANITITPYFEAPGVQSISASGKAALCGSSPQCTIGTETFSNIPGNQLSGYHSSFGNNGVITGTFSGSGKILSADQYGGAGGTGKYLAVTPSSAVTLTLSQPVNFFGLWFSALDSSNSLAFYQTGNSTPVYTFGASQFQSLVGNCPGTGFCGNPNAPFLGANKGQQYAFLDFVATGGTFNSVVISQGGSGNFEADNETVGFITDANPTGTAFTPEPTGMGMGMIGAGILGLCLRSSRLRARLSF